MIFTYRVLIVILFTGHFSFAGGITKEDPLAQLLEEATTLEQEKEFEDALVLYNKALSIAASTGRIEDTSFIYKKIGLIHYRQKDYTTAKSYFKKSIKESSSSQAAADSYFNLTLIFRREKQRDSMLWHLDESLRIYQMLEDSPEKFSTYSKAGIILKQALKFDTAIEYLILAYDGFVSFEDNASLATVSGNIADIQRHLGNFEISKKYYYQHLALRLKLPDTLKQSFALNNFGNLYYELKQYDSALVYYQKALSLQELLGNRKNIANTLSNLGMTYAKQDDFNNAKSHYQRALPIKLELRDTNAIVSIYSELIFLNSQKKGNVTTARYISQAQKYKIGVTDNIVALRYFFVLAKYYQGIGDYKKALEFRESQFNLYKTYFNTQQAQEIQALQEQFESSQKQQQIDQLSFDKQKDQLTINIQKERIRTRGLYVVVLALGLLLLLGILYLLKQKQKAKIQKLKLNELQSVITGQENIKQHISNDLHDMVTTSYDAIRLKILAMEKSKDPKSLGNAIIKDIKSINREIRLISHRLSPLGDKIRESSLTELVVLQLSEFQFYRKIFIDVQLPLPRELNSLSIDAQTNFYGILLESLNNIEKHSQATSVTISHKVIKDKALKFSICDNGIGMDKKTNGGIGLSSIKQRAKLLKGEASFDSDQKGTCVILTFPIKDNTE